MGLLDPLFNAVSFLIEGFERVTQAITNPQIDDQQASEIAGTTLEDVNPADEVSATIVDVIEEQILSDLQDAGELTEANVEQVADQTEGASVATLAGFHLAAIGIEASSLGQLDGQSELVAQAMTGLAIDDVTGMELEARSKEGIMPALEAKVNRDHRSKYINLQDQIEYDLRRKDSDTGFIDDIGQYGIRPDQLEALERVALKIPEPEELFEELPQAGIVPSEEAVDDILSNSGFPENVKEEYRRLQEATPERADLWEQRTRTGELVRELDKLVIDGELSPEDAMAQLPDQVDESREALRGRWQLMSTLPGDAPTRSQVENSFTSGLTDLSTFQDRLSRVDVDPQEYPDIVDEAILSELDGDLQEGVGLGLLSESDYSNLAQRVGLDDEAVAGLLRGQSISDITERRLAEAGDPTTQDVETIVGIGPGRAGALRAIDIETVGDLVNADPQAVADATQVSPETAQQWIDSATARTTDQE